MIQIAICDDETSQRRMLKQILVPWLELNDIAYMIHEFNCGEDLYIEYKKNRFDLIFLDIEMGGINGMDTARKLRTIDSFGILIFITSYSDYVFQGYEVQAFHYILKPLKQEKILDVTNTALQELKKRENDFIYIPQSSGNQRLNLGETLYFTSDRRQITAVTVTENITFYEKLNDFEKELPDYFCRIHQRYLINLNKIRKTDDAFVYIGDEKLPVSRAHKQTFLIAFAKSMLRKG